MERISDNMNISYAFSVLEIEPTNDKKVIKKAYAGLVKKYHPEEYPEKWEVIHEAYETLIREAEGQSDFNQQKIIPNEIPNDEEVFGKKKYNHQDIEVKSFLPAIEGYDSRFTDKTTANSEEKIEEDFENIKELAIQQRKKEEEKREQEIAEVIQKLEILARKTKRRVNMREWKSFFLAEENLPGIISGEFWYKLGDLLPKMRVNDKLFYFLKRQLQLMADYQKVEKIKLKKSGLLEPLDFAEGRLQEARRRTFTFSPRNVAMLVFFVLLVISGLVSMEETRERTEREKKEAMQEKIEQFSLDKIMNKPHVFLESSESSYDNHAERILLMENTEEEQQKLLDSGICLREGMYLTEINIECTSGKSIEEEEYSVEEVKISDDFLKLLGIDILTDHVLAFKLETEDTVGKALWMDIEKLNFTENCTIYYYEVSEGGYIEVPERDGEENGCYLYEVLGYHVFAADPGSYAIIIAEKAEQR